MSDPTTADCVALWIGPRLGSLERACLRSVIRHGHSVALYCYRKPEGVPDGVEVRDGASVLPESCVFRHRSGSFAPFSDWFRYEAQRRGLGTWVDTDIYLLAPFDLTRPHLFGEELPGVLNNAVLRLPPNSPMLGPLLAPFSGRTPDWLPLRAYASTLLRKWLGGPVSPAELPWGSTGPAALTAAASRFGLLGEALPPAAFYPATWQDAAWILDPARPLAQVAGPQSVAVHLWNDRIQSFKHLPAPPGSFLERLQREGQ